MTLQVTLLARFRLQIREVKGMSEITPMTPGMSYQEMVGIREDTIDVPGIYHASSVATSNMLNDLFLSYAQRYPDKMWVSELASVIENVTESMTTEIGIKISNDLPIQTIIAERLADHVMDLIKQKTGWVK